MDLDNPGAKMRLALLHLTNAIANEVLAAAMTGAHRAVATTDRNKELLKTIQFCYASMRTAARPYRRRVRRDVRRPQPQKQPQRRPAP